MAVSHYRFRTAYHEFQSRQNFCISIFEMNMGDLNFSRLWTRLAKSRPQSMQAIGESQSDLNQTWKLGPCNVTYTSVIAAVLIVQFFFLCITFPIQELFTTKPLLRVDSPFHWYQIWVAAQFGINHLIVGFDPFMSAGYMNGVTYNSSARIPALFATLFPTLAQPTVIYKCFSFFSALLAPACLPVTARTLRLGVLPAAIASIAGVILWWVSALRGYHTSGMVSFIFASFWGVAYATTIIQLAISKFSFWKSALSGFIGALGFLYHPLFPIIVFPIVVAALIFMRHQIIWRNLWMSYMVVGLCALIPNLPWILAMRNYPGVSDNGIMHYFKETGFHLIVEHFFWIQYSDSRFQPALVIGTIGGCLLIANDFKRQIAKTFTAGAVLMLLFGAFAAYLPALAILQPNRFMMTASVVLVIPGAMGTAEIFKQATRSKVIIISAFVLCVLTAYSLNEVRRELLSTSSGHHGVVPPEVRGEGEVTSWLIQWIKNNTDQDSRILFEHSSQGVYDTAHIAGYLAIQTKREFIGGAYPMKTMASFWDGWIFGQSIDAFSPNELFDYFRLYNIGWAIVHSDKSVRYLNQLPGVKLIAERGKIKIFRIENPPGFVFHGSGKVVERTVNRIVVNGLNNSETILRYHFFPCLSVDPPTQIDGVMIKPDTNPFIRLRGSTSRVIISCR